MVVLCCARYGGCHHRHRRAALVGLGLDASPATWSTGRGVEHHAHDVARGVARSAACGCSMLVGSWSAGAASVVACGFGKLQSPMAQ